MLDESLATSGTTGEDGANGPAKVKVSLIRGAGPEPKGTEAAAAAAAAASPALPSGGIGRLTGAPLVVTEGKSSVG